MSLLSEEELEALTGRSLTKQKTAPIEKRKEFSAKDFASQLEVSISEFVGTNTEVRHVTVFDPKKHNKPLFCWEVPETPRRLNLYIEENLLNTFLSHLSSFGNSSKKESWVNTGPIGSALRSFFLLQFSSLFLNQEKKLSRSYSFSVQFLQTQGFICFEFKKNAEEEKKDNTSKNTASDRKKEKTNNHHNQEEQTATQKPEKNVKNSESTIEKVSSNTFHHLPWFKQEILRNAQVNLEINLPLQIVFNDQFFAEENSQICVKMSPYGQLMSNNQPVTSIKFDYENKTPYIQKNSSDGQETMSDQTQNYITSSFQLNIKLSPMAITHFIHSNFNQSRSLDLNLIDEITLQLSQERTVTCKIESWTNEQQILTFEHV